jgi:flavin-dependent dehydrogenase
VCILGGGLAGLTLAIQLKSARPATRIAVLEKREGPAPLAAFKVGESTVPAGAHYFAEVVGMKDHLEKEQLIKCGLRYFLPVDGNRDITQRVEVGPRDFPEHDNYQVDRGLFENRLAQRVRTLDIDLLQGCRVKEVDLGSEEHEIRFTQCDADELTSTKARWVVDAAGRASFLKRKLGLGFDSGHHVNSAWFRLAGGLDFEQWGIDNERWMARMARPGIRQFSTNHLMGKGYWIWLIPLSTGPISIGVCADADIHPYEEIATFEALLTWLQTHEPQLAAAVESRTEDIEDFLRVKDYSYDVEQAFNAADRWTLVGEAAAFADPLFSPGSDFIGLSNSFSADLIARDLDGEDITDRAAYWNDLYKRSFDFVISKYRNMFAVFEDAYVTSGLLGWDVYVNHANLISLFTRNKITDLKYVQSVEDDLHAMFALGVRMQTLFREWYDLRRASGPAAPAPFIHAYRPASLPALVAEFDDAALRDQLAVERRTMESIAVAIFHKAAADLPDPPPADRPVNPYAVSLRPDSWEAEGLWAEPGLTLAQAAENADAYERMWADPSRPPGPPVHGGRQGMAPTPTA